MDITQSKSEEVKQFTEHATGTDTVAAEYNITRACKIASFQFYKPSASTITVKRRIDGDSTKEILLFTNSGNASGCVLQDIPLFQNDQILIDIDGTNGTKGFSLIMDGLF